MNPVLPVPRLQPLRRGIRDGISRSTMLFEQDAVTTSTSALAWRVPVVKVRSSHSLGLLIGQQQDIAPAGRLHAPRDGRRIDVQE